MTSWIARRWGHQTYWWLRPKHFRRCCLGIDMSLVGPTGVQLSEFSVSSGFQWLPCCWVLVLFHLIIQSWFWCIDELEDLHPNRVIYMVMHHNRTHCEVCDHVKPHALFVLCRLLSCLLFGAGCGIRLHSVPDHCHFIDHAPVCLIQLVFPFIWFTELAEEFRMFGDDFSVFNHWVVV